MDVRVVDDSGVEVKPGEMGNLVLAYPLSPTALPTLWKNREGFEKSYLARFKGKGDWFDTGDSATIDDAGFVHLAGRQDDLINVSAHRLATSLIEQVVTSHASVIECCVVGAPDALKGQSPFALLVAAASSGAGLASAGPVSSANDAAAQAMLRDINAHIRAELGPIAQLSGLVVAEKLPKTRSGKTLRRSVRAIVEHAAVKNDKGEVPVPPTVEDASVIPLVKKAIFQHFDKPPAKL